MSERTVGTAEPTRKPSLTLAHAPALIDHGVVVRSTQFLRFEMLLAMSATVTAAWLQLSFGENALGLIVIGAFAATVASMVWCLRRITVDNAVQTLLIATATLWISTMIVAPLIPFGLPIMSFPMVIPLLVAGPVLPRRQLAWFVLAAASAMGIVAAEALVFGTDELQRLIPQQQQSTIIVSSFAVRAVTISLAAWDANARRDAALADAARARDEIRDSRRRLVAAGDEQRREIERNLHDGAQQEFIAVAMRLRMLGARHPALADDLAPLQSSLQSAIDELRDVAHGIYPPLLQRGGLTPALQAAARRTGDAVTVSADDVGRASEPVEAALYYCCLEALQNAAKHAGASAHVTVTLERIAWPASVAAADTAASTHRGLRLTVNDDGTGFDPAAAERGRGLQNIDDRVGAVAGTLAVSSTPGGGTTLTIDVPA